MDSVLHDQRPRRSTFPTMLFAPTWNPSLSAAPMIGEDSFEQICREFPNLRVIIKPHPGTPDRSPEWMEAWRRIAKRHPMVQLIDDAHANIYDLIGEVDVLLSDISSVIFFFLAVDRPIILVDSPEDQRDPSAVDPEAPEWVWRDVGLRIDSPAKLCGAIERCLTHPDEKAEIRAEYRRRVFGEGLKDRASKLIAQNIRMLLRPAPEEQALAELTWNAIRSFAAYDQRSYREQFNTFVETLYLRLTRSVARRPLLERNLRTIVHKIVRD
jgi:CDP-glycerol glycerophosphotransferase (TagB/SpsB family)